MLVLSAIWGSSFLFIKVGVSELHPLYVALGRVGSGAIALLLILLLTQSPLPRDLRVWGHNAVVAIVGVAVPFTLFGYGEQHVSSILAGIWNSAWSCQRCNSLSLAPPLRSLPRCSARRRPPSIPCPGR